MQIEGMHCGSCAIGIQMVVSQLEGVSSAEVSFERKQGTFAFDQAKVSREKIMQEIETLGYSAK